jgi:DNA-binding NtrC family response regulator
VVDDEESIRISLAEALADATTTVRTAATGAEAMAVLDSTVIDLVLLDQKLRQSGEDGLDVLRKIRAQHPDVLSIMMTAYGRIESAVEAIKLGCIQYISKPLDVNQLKILIASALSTGRLQREVEVLRNHQRRVFSPVEVFGDSKKTRELLDHVQRAARSATSTVLIRGETGVGKELIARQIHTASPVAAGAFVDFNCSAVPDNLIESELFGFERGAFTDAKVAKRGLFELADRGSLFLDEIGEMPLPMQSKLLRVLETKSFRRLGSTVDVHVQVRTIAATNRDLLQLVATNRFREDLFYRLDVIPVFVPPLRERKEDISTLTLHFLERFNRELGRSIRRITPAAMDELIAYSWPGNIRELRNLIERMVLMTQSDEILPEDLPNHIRVGSGGPNGTRSSPRFSFPTDRRFTLEEAERAAILHAIERTGGNKTKAAEFLGISRQTLRTRLKELGSEDGTDLSAAS